MPTPEHIAAWLEERKFKDWLDKRRVENDEVRRTKAPPNALGRVADFLGERTREFTEGLVGVPGTAWGEGMNAAMAAGRSVLPGGQSYADELEKVRLAREERYPGAYSVIPEVRIPARRAALEEDSASQAMGIAAPIRTIGPGFAPTFFHGGPKPVQQINTAQLQRRDSGWRGPGFYGTEEFPVAADYAKRAAGSFPPEGPGVITEFTLKPGTKVFDIAKDPRRADPAYTTIDPGDAAMVVEWLRRDPDRDLVIRGEELTAGEWASRLEGRGGFSMGDWPVLANHYSRENGIGAVRTPGETVVTDPGAYSFQGVRREPPGGDPLRGLSDVDRNAVQALDAARRYGAEPSEAFGWAAETLRAFTKDADPATQQAQMAALEKVAANPHFSFLAKRLKSKDQGE